MNRIQRRLQWNAIGLVRKTELLREVLLKEKGKIPADHTGKHETIQGFIDELTNFLDKMTLIEKDLIPKLEKIFKLHFKTPELVMLALTRPSVKTVFHNIENFLENKEENPLTSEDFKEIESSGDASNVLALIGDAVIDVAIFQILWDPSLSTAGKLSDKRVEIANNKNLAIFCDKWNLYEYRLKRLPEPSEDLAKDDSIEHEKGTLVEAIYGLIYLEFGLDELIRSVTLIQK